MEFVSDLPTPAKFIYLPFYLRYVHHSLVLGVEKNLRRPLTKVSRGPGLVIPILDTPKQ